MTDDDLAYLRDAHDQGLLVPFVGAGLPVAAAGLPDWLGLLHAGLEYAVVQRGAAAADPRLAFAKAQAGSGELLAAFEVMVELLREPGGPGDGFAAFLAELFAEPEIRSRELLDALHFLGARRVITTNYDTLMESHGIGGGQGFTWQQPDFLNVFRTGRGVVHLHGKWDLPESVVLTTTSYERVSADPRARLIARAVFHAGVLLFVGTSLDGTSDPHLGTLLAEFSELADAAAGVRRPHVMLVRERVNGDTRARLNAQGIRAVSYGDSHADLPQYLRNIASTGRVDLGVQPTSYLLREVYAADSLDQALHAVAAWITTEVFAGRSVRLGFSAKTRDGNGYLLTPRAVVPQGGSRNPLNYPLSIAAWALLEGRPIGWPADSGRAADLRWLEALGKLDEVQRRVASPDMEALPELQRYVNLTIVRKRLEAGTLALGDFFQDWVARQPQATYRQFLSVPVPVVDTAANRGSAPPEHGVFNIDSNDSAPLGDARTLALLRLASGVAALAFRLFGPEDTPPPARRRGLFRARRGGA